MFKDFVQCSDMISNAYTSIERNTLEKNNKFYASWKKVVTQIKRFDDENFGQKLYEHSNIVDVKNDILLIETDHSGWSQMMQLNSKFILNGLKMYIPEMNIKSLAFRTKGSNAVLSNVNYSEELKKQNARNLKKMEESDEILKKYEKNTEFYSQNCDLPEEIKNKFESMKNSMLTKTNG